MRIKKVSFEKYKVLENINISFEHKEGHNFFPIISINGGGKSSMLQFIFSFLHLPFTPSRQPFLKALLKSIELPSNKNALNKIIQYEIEDNDKLINLSFFVCKSSYKDWNFDSIIQLDEMKNLRKKSETIVKKIQLLNNLEKDLVIGNISVNIALRELELREFISNRREVEEILRGRTNQTDLISFMQDKKKELESSLIGDDEINELIIKSEAEKNKLSSQLGLESLEYVLHFEDNNHILLYNSNVTLKYLKELSDKIYLAVPNTQILHFLQDEKLETLFTNEKYHYNSYEYYIKECQKAVIGLFTYDFSAIDLILEALKKARDDDFKKAIEIGVYGDEIKTTIKELNNLLSGKSITISPNFGGVTFKLSNSNKTLTPKDLSHGELKKLSIYIWLKARTNNDSVILMDEVDMGLHPTWQYDLHDDLQKWGKGNQFIVATHSPQIISKSYYKNLVVLKPSKKGTTVEQFTQPPLESDLNTVVKTIMGGDYIPKELLDLRRKYRALFEKDMLDSAEAIEIKEKILDYESENSSFFQDIKFQIQLR